MSDSLRILSLGAGVQSTTVLLMSLYEQLPPLDAAIFADTGWEPQAVYRHLDWLAGECERGGVPLYRVSAGNLRADSLSGISRARIPIHVAGPKGAGMAPRHCTKTYKIEPIRRKVGALSWAAGRAHVQQVIGISLDEATRMKSSDVKYITHVYPLVERRMTRGDCLLWLERHGFPRPPKSSCIGCPYHTNAEWRAIRSDPAAWADAIAYDEALRAPGSVAGGPCSHGPNYLHRQLKPLPMVDLSTPQERGQLSFLDECEGMCGV